MTKVNLIESPYPLQSIKGLGPKRIALLQELNINTVEDLVLIYRLDTKIIQL